MTSRVVGCIMVKFFGGTDFLMELLVLNTYTANIFAMVIKLTAAAYMISFSAFNLHNNIWSKEMLIWSWYYSVLHISCCIMNIESGWYYK